MSDLQKIILPDRPTLSNFGVADRQTTGIVLGQIYTSYNGRGKPTMAFPDSDSCKDQRFRANSRFQKNKIQKITCINNRCGIVPGGSCTA